MRRLAALAFVVASLPAEESPREGILGAVRTADAKPWVGATATLLHIAHRRSPMRGSSIASRDDRRTRPLPGRPGIHARPIPVIVS